MKLDEKDMTILKNLTTDARLSARKLAHMVGVSTATVLSKIRKMEGAGIISRYSAVIDYEKIGYSLTAVIEIASKKSKIIDVEAGVAKLENVCAVYDVTGPTDMLIIAKFKTREDLSRFVKKLAVTPNVDNTITHVVLDTAKEDFRLV